MAFFTYLIAFGHFVSEVLVYRTARVPGPVLTSLFIASAVHLSSILPTLTLKRLATTLIWMFQQYSFYVKV